MIDFGRRFLHLKDMSDEDAILAANAAYYQAFRQADFTAMSRVWADDDVSCIHPGWPVLIGRQTVLESYRNILGSPNRDWIEDRSARAMLSASEGRVFCVEFVGGSALATTNWFRRIDGRWRMIHHQASPIASLVVEDSDPPPSPQRLN